MKSPHENASLWPHCKPAASASVPAGGHVAKAARDAAAPVKTTTRSGDSTKKTRGNLCGTKLPGWLVVGPPPTVY